MSTNVIGILVMAALQITSLGCLVLLIVKGKDPNVLLGVIASATMAVAGLINPRRNDTTPDNTTEREDDIP